MDLLIWIVKFGGFAILAILAVYLTARVAALGILQSYRQFNEVRKTAEKEERIRGL